MPYSDVMALDMALDNAFLMQWLQTMPYFDAMALDNGLNASILYVMAYDNALF